MFGVSSRVFRIWVSDKSCRKFAACLNGLLCRLAKKIATSTSTTTDVTRRRQDIIQLLLKQEKENDRHDNINSHKQKLIT